MTERVIFTVGHSNHDADRFLELLAGVRVGLLVDVRSQPYSRYTPHFTKQPLSKLLREAGVDYWHAAGLGGRPDEPEMYDSAGHVLYGEVAASEPFHDAVSDLERRAAGTTTAIMCGEEDPTDCHRRLLVGRVLGQRGWQIKHIRGDGSIQPEEALAGSAVEQPGLFEGGEFSTWRSVRSVSPSGPQRTSSEP